MLDGASTIDMGFGVVDEGALKVHRCLAATSLPTLLSGQRHSDKESYINGWEELHHFILVVLESIIEGSHQPLGHII